MTILTTAPPHPLAGPDAAAPLLELPLHARRSKRALDLALSALALLVVLPVVVLVALVIRAADRGPVLFRQTRVGADGQWITVLKFRSMRPDAEAVLYQDPVLYQRYLDGDHKLSPDVDVRLTRVGRFLRSTSLDELPQLWNVLRGDMSLVGPRPVLPDELDCYGPLVPYYLTAKPGLTGVWQVSGRSRVGFPQRAELDAAYVDGWTFARDCELLLRTPLAVLRRIGAH